MSIEVVNTQNTPELVVLSSRNGTNKDTTLSSVTWPLSEPIEPPGDNMAAKISVHSMVFYNTFQNISASNNVLKVVSMFRAGGLLFEDLFVLTVPTGFYTITELLVQLNARGSRDEGGWRYGFGDTGTTNPGFIDNITPAVVSLVCPSLASLGVRDDAHQYLGFYLQLDDETKPLMQVLGFAEEVQPNIYKDTHPIPDTTKLGVGFILKDTGVGSAYTIQNATTHGVQVYDVDATPLTYALVDRPKLLSPSTYNLTRQSAILVKLGGVRSDVRAGSSLSKGSTLAMIPVTAAYANQVIYQPPNPFKSLVSSISLGHITITITNAIDGSLVDFAGVDYMLTLHVEWFEVDNSKKSESSIEGLTEKVMPIYKHETPNHLLPYSGYANPHPSAQKKRRGNHVYN